MRKETQSLRDLRAWLIRRVQRVQEGLEIDLLEEVDVGMAMAARLMSSGVIVPADLDYFEDALPEVENGNIAFRVAESRLKRAVFERLQKVADGTNDKELARADYFLNDLAAFIGELVYYRQVYRSMAIGVSSMNDRLTKQRGTPSFDRLETVERNAYRAEDPREVLAASKSQMAIHRARISWANGRLKREKILVPPSVAKKIGRPRKNDPEVDYFPNRVSVRTVTASFKTPEITRRFNKLRRPRDLLRDVGIDDESPVVPESSGGPLPEA
jgi:hypothetical protein